MAVNEAKHEAFTWLRSFTFIRGLLPVAHLKEW